MYMTFYIYDIEMCCEYNIYDAYRLDMFMLTPDILAVICYCCWCLLLFAAAAAAVEYRWSSSKAVGH